MAFPFLNRKYLSCGSNPDKIVQKLFMTRSYEFFNSIRRYFIALQLLNRLKQVQTRCINIILSGKNT